MTPSLKRHAVRVADQVGLHNHPAQLLQGRLGLPAKYLLRLCGIADQQLDLRGTVKTRIYPEDGLAGSLVDASLSFPFTLEGYTSYRHKVTFLECLKIQRE